MLKWFDNVKVLHLEPTDVCQAACPLCARETDTTFDKSVHHNLTVADLDQLLPENVIAGLDKMFMCGNYGDPAASNETLSIYKRFRQVNPNITLGMNTNGGLQSAKWWEELAQIMNQPKDYVVFSIDGLESTNDIYRKNVNWDKLMANVQAFIRAGGQAHWDMLVYSYNEHQVDLAQELAYKLGFKWFRVKVSRRPTNIIEFKQPKGWISPVIEKGPIDCFRDNDNSIYISAQGEIYPCCWLGYTDSTLDKFDDVRLSWTTDKCNPTCSKFCTSSNKKSRFTNQWQREIEFKNQIMNS